MNRRVRTGCGTCRKRRIKCDEQKPTCARCRAANFECDGYEQLRKVGSPSSAKSRDSPPHRVSPRAEALVPDLQSRRVNWRQDHLPLYHHFITSTVYRLFRGDHVNFWRDEVGQMSWEVDIVYEALLAIAAAHRATLLSCTKSNTQEIAKWKVMGLSAYGKTLRTIANNGCNMQDAPMMALKAKLIALLLLSYFECFMENPKGVFRHLWQAILILRVIEERASPEEVESIAPLQEVILRLDFLAQKLVPFARSSFLRGSDLAFMQLPFWNRPSLEFSGSTPLDPMNTECNNLIRLVGGHNKINHVVWGCWYATSERPTREELMGFYSEMLLWRSASPATFASCPDLDDFQPSSIEDFRSLPIPPEPLHFSSNEAALNVVMYNGYLGCALAMISTTDEDPAPREMEIFRLAYENMRICAGLLDMKPGQIPSSYKPCETLNMGISIFLYHAVRRCFSLEWQKWSIEALRSVGSEGLSNGHVFANTLEVMRHLQSTPHCIESERHIVKGHAPLGAVRDRLVPMLLPQGDDGKLTAFYLKYGIGEDDADESVVRVLARATWKQDEAGGMVGLNLQSLDEIRAAFMSGTPWKPEMLSSWRTSVEPGWHGFLYLPTLGEADGAA